MTIKTQSQAIKQQGSAMRRTATSVRGIAGNINDPTRMRKLLDAAAIIDAEAAATMQRSRMKLQEEKHYEAVKAKALPLARELVKTLPMNTTAEKLAVLDESFHGCYMRSRIVDQAGMCKVDQAYLQRELDEGLEDIAQSLAHTSARTGRPPEINEHLLVRLKLQSMHHENVKAAEIFDRINTEVAPC